ncbi:acyltransferase family protein [Mucilaginibacter polytrichastri]|uniref:Acyltransferase 3 domain-containing protein n=1 Tax=Mucilaginibacter polytrichastri TaxID=1302689 RepID=A0A1Q5ZTR3_9SPHI|nr:acyltransferase family protein [Mucilaginibacter polytrichastri]OKS85162.1 hypothetical protein RG47T_0606 [Mucilaginibacter polytrichastri]SFS43475.1 Peptidoglycan/LPS O-acetylase OafA/YrhL, contains acyltransferase and SGNH-hydrolase domains [Mucilaginibacter polytrichastri]
MTEKKYNWEFLSLTRFLLAFIVLSGHLKVYTDIGLLNWYTKFGSFEAIFGFLLISGFSIGKSIQKNKKSYFLRRAERIYPVYIASIILLLITIPPNFSGSFIIVLLINLVFMNQVLIGTSLVGPAWSLALEVWLYAFAPLLLKASYKLLIYLIATSFICYCGYTLGRTLFHWPYYSGTKFGINLILLSFIWIAGFGLATHQSQIKLFSKVIASIFILHILLTVTIQLLFRLKHHKFHEFIATDVVIYVFASLCLLGVFYIVVLNHRLPALSINTKKLFHLLGNISYPLYLIHCSVFDFLKKLNILNVPLMIIISLAASYIIYYIFDFYSRRRAIS